MKLLKTQTNKSKKFLGKETQNLSKEWWIQLKMNILPSIMTKRKDRDNKKINWEKKPPINNNKMKSDLIEEMNENYKSITSNTLT